MILGPSSKQSHPGPSTKQSQHKGQLNLIDQLGKTPTQISILELLRISLAHKAILGNNLQESSVTHDIDVNQFESMVRYLTTPHLITFLDQDYSILKPSHNDKLHIEFFIHKHKVRWVLVYGRARLNICSLKLVKALGFSDAHVDATMSIVIKAYDDEKCSFQGIITLPIRVGRIILDTTCQVLDLELPYNILLGRTWIHALKVVPSTYHQCLKFPFGNTEITIHGDPDPFLYCTNLRGISEHQLPINWKASTSSSSKYIDPSTLSKSSTSTPLSSTTPSPSIPKANPNIKI